MGLLDNPEVLQALQLLSARKGELGGLLGQFGQQNEQRKQRALQEEMQRQVMEQQRLQLEQQRRAMGQQDQMDSLAKRSFAPNQNLVQNDDEGNPMPSSGGGGFPEYARGMMQIDPMKGLGIQSQLAQMNAKERVKLAPGETVGQWEGNRFVPGYSAPERAKMPEHGKIREVIKGGNLTQEAWDGQDWKPIGQGPRFKPNDPDKPSPQQHVMVGDVAYSFDPKTGRYSPAVAADGSPVAKPPKPPARLTEGEAKATLYTGMMDDAEANIAKLNFDPTKLNNQTDIALARGDVPKVPKILQNAVASKQAQQYAQGTFQWTEAVLRQLTGAAAPESEVWRQVKTYWPQPGDKPENVAQKNAARARVAQMVRLVAGEGAARVDATPRAEKPDPLGIR